MDINNNGTIIKVYPSDESELTTGVMTSGKVVLHFRSDQDIKLEQGATIEFLGNTYTLVYPQETKKLWRGYLEYIATFYSSAEQLKHKLLKDPSNIARTSFVFAGSPTDFATLVARSMGHEWSVGNCVATSYDKTIAFKEESCWAALGRVAEEFHTEWVIDGKSISLRKDERFKEDPLPLSYGKGNGFLSGVSQRGNADNLPISRLYVLGSSRNIDPTKYGASTLHLPKSWSGERMRTDEAGNYIELLEGNGAEGSMELSDLYPHRVGVVSSVVVANEAKHFYDIIDSSIPEELNYNDYRIRGEKAILKFETGALAGRQFEIRQSEVALSGYHHQERRFEIIPSEQDGFIMPSKEWAPKAGDRYAIFGIALPEEYVTRAENELLKEAIRTLSERSLPQFTFEGEVDGVWAKRKWLEIGGKLVPGGHVLFSDPEFHPEGTVIRITSMAQKVNNPTAPSITLSTALVGGSLWNVLNRTEAQEVLSQKRDRELQRSQRQSYEQALEHIGMVERAVEGVEGFSKRIKPSVIETMGLLVGSQATQLDFVERYGSLKSVPMAINYNPTDKRVTISNAFIRHQTIGITSITNARKPTDYRYWSVARYTSPALTESEQSYYIYAKVEREGKGGNYLLSPEPLPFETNTHYHLLIGTLSSLIDGDRAYNRLYGFSMVTPGQILTDTISSANGNMTIDLQNGSIISDQIEFRRPDGSTKSVEEVITDTVQVGGRNLLLKTWGERGFSRDWGKWDWDEKETKLTVKSNDRWNSWRFLDNTYLAGGTKVSNLTGPFILSCYVRGKGQVNFYLAWDYYGGGRDNKTITLTDSWQRLVFIANKEYPDKGVLFGANQDGTQAREGNWLQYDKTRWKLERGTIATDWSPAPEDVQAEIDAINANPPRINQTTKNWEVYVPSQGKYVDTGRTSVGDDGKAPKIVDGYWYEWDSNKGQYTNTDIKARGEDGKDATQVRDNLWTSSQYSLSLNDNYGCYLTSLPDRKFKIEKKEPSKVSWFSAASYYTYPIKNPAGRYTISFKVIECSRPIRFYYDTNIDKKKGDLVGDFYYHTNVSSDGRLPGFAFTWGEADTDDQAKIGDYAIIKDIKIERVKEGEDPRPTAYLPHPDDTKGDKGDKGDGLEIKDTRNDNQLPNWYRANYGQTTVREFKHQDIIGIPSSWMDGSYCTLETVVKWADTSGGRVTQKATLNSGQELYRVGSADDSRWEAWSNIKAEMQEINAGLTNANTLISTLDKAQKQLEKGVLTKADTKDIQYLLDSLKKGKTQVAGGLVLTNDIILSEPTTGQVTATISGTANTGANALRLGIQYPDSVAIATLLDSGKVKFGADVTTDEQREQSLLKQGYTVVYKFPNIRNWIVRSTASTGELTTLRNDGTGHIGQLHFDSDRIVVAPIGDISKAFMEFGRNVMKQTIQEVLQANAIDSTTKVQDVRVIEGQSITRTFEVLNDNTSVTIDMDLKIDEEEDVVHWDGTPPSGTGDADNSPKQLLVKMDDDRGLFAYAIEGWRDKGCFPETDFDKHGLRVWTCKKVIPPSTTSIHKTVILHQGTHTLTFYTNFGRGGANNIKVSQKYSTNYRQTSFSDRGMRIYGGGDSYVDFNHDHPEGATFATIGGGLKVDTITADSYQGNGMPLAGATFNSSGGEVRALGRYKNKSGSSSASAYYDYSYKTYTVHHSIPHDRYIPLVTPFGVTGNNGFWNLSVRVYEVKAYSFTMALLTNGDNPTQNGFSYVAFQAE